MLHEGVSVSFSLLTDYDLLQLLSCFWVKCMTLLLFALSDVYVQYSAQPLFVLTTTLHVICVSRYGLSKCSVSKCCFLEEETPRKLAGHLFMSSEKQNLPHRYMWYIFLNHPLWCSKITDGWWPEGHTLASHVGYSWSDITYYFSSEILASIMDIWKEVWNPKFLGFGFGLMEQMWADNQVSCWVWVSFGLQHILYDCQIQLVFWWTENDPCC